MTTEDTETDILAAVERDDGVSVHVLAKLWACDKRTVERQAKLGVVVKVGRGKYAVRSSTLNYAQKLRREAKRRIGTGDVDAVAESALLKREQRALVALRREMLSAELISIDEAHAAWSRFVRVVRYWVMSIPKKVQSELPHITAQETRVVERLCQEALVDMTDKPPDLPIKRG